jgi:hypothetical protein
MNRDLDTSIKVKRAATNTSVTAGGTGDATEVAGVAIQRTVIGLPRSAVFAIPFTATLAATKTLSIACIVEHSSAAASGYADLVNVASAVVATGATGGSTETGCVEIGVDLSGAKDYVRIRFTPDLSATATDTAALSAVAVLGSFQELPQ